MGDLGEHDPGAVVLAGHRVRAEAIRGPGPRTVLPTTASTSRPPTPCAAVSRAVTQEPMALSRAPGRQRPASARSWPDPGQLPVIPAWRAGRPGRRRGSTDRQSQHRGQPIPYPRGFSRIGHVPQRLDQSAGTAPAGGPSPASGQEDKGGQAVGEDDTAGTLTGMITTKFGHLMITSPGSACYGILSSQEPSPPKTPNPITQRRCALPIITPSPGHAPPSANRACVTFARAQTAWRCRSAASGTRRPAGLPPLVHGLGVGAGSDHRS